MTDDKEKPDDDATRAQTEGPAGGERLAEARREKQISVLEIAKELHVDEAKIRALENNDFNALGAPVFAKGHLKKYAQLVGVNHDDVLADYYRLTRSQEMPPVVVKRQKPRRELTPGPWIATAVALVLLALAYWLLVERPFVTLPAPAVTRAPATETVSPTVPAPDDDEPAGESAAEPAGQAVSEAEPPAGSAVAEPVEPVATSTELPPATGPTAQPAIDDGDVRLSVTFIGDCWTEITDASGRRLFFQLGRGGRTVNVSGNAPVSVLFGDVDNVEVRVNGEDFTIPADSRRGRTARFTISGT